MAKQKEDLDSKEVMEPTNEEFRAIKAEYDALKCRLGSAEYKFIFVISFSISYTTNTKAPSPPFYQALVKGQNR